MDTSDMSSSSDYTAYTGGGNSNVSYNNSGQNTSYYYKDSEGTYHQITITRTGWDYNRTHTITVSGYNGTQTHSGNNLRMSDLASYVSTIVGKTVTYNSLYTASTQNITRIAALKLAVNGFLEQIADQNAEVEDAKDYSTVSIVTYNSGISVETGSEASNKDSFVPVIWSGEGDDKKVVDNNGTDLEALVNGIGTSQGTRTDSGMGAAANILNDLGTSTERNHIVVLFTDGYPSTSGSSNFDTTYARSAVNYALTCKSTHKATVFSIAVLEGADPTIDPINGSYSTTNIGNVNRMLHGISSNFPNATSYTADSLGTRAQGDHYFKASNADDLKNIFNAIAKEAGSTSSEVSKDAVMKDIVSSSFTLPEGATTENITISIVPWDSTNHTWSITTSYTADQWKAACLNYGAEEAENVVVTISEDGKTIDITGFDYSTHFLATSDPAKDKDGVNAQAAKIVVSFPIQARPSAITGSSVATNGKDSGIYLNAEATTAVAYFPVPEVTFTPVTYVVDYVTSDTTTDTKASSVKLEYDTVLNNVQMLDDPSDDYLIGEEAEDFAYTIYKGKYGTISFGDDADDVQRRYVRYAPTTMNWDGYDRIFVKGESATTSDLDVWACLSVLPANSVYYEDTYITQTKSVTYNGKTVEIQYTGINYDKDKWTTDGTEGNNTTQHAGNTMGWIDGLADDTGYSNGIAHTADTNGATASFTFSGTGVDIYSRTNGTTGKILVSIKGNGVSKSKIIDNKAASGDYYQIPTCTFTDLPYGEYTVTIRVSSVAKESRFVYYLDGVRVYNPIQPLEENEFVQTVYGEENLGAVFTEVRSLLLAGTDAEAEAVFIDENEEHVTSTDLNDFNTYGPKAEIYLQSEQSVVLSLDGDHTYYLGLKEIAGNGTTAEINGAELNIAHTSDLYYKVTPSDGKVTIENTGDGILSITKLRTTNAAASEGTDNTNGTLSVPTESLLAAYRSVKALPTTLYTSEVLAEEEVEEPVVETPAEEVPAEEPATEELDADDIVIDNPEPEAPAEEPAAPAPSTNSFLSRILSSFLGLFRR